jgi:general secretion pathway protein G
VHPDTTDNQNKETIMNIQEKLLAHIRRVREALRSKGGFTLIEIMIVVSIIALLMGVLVGPQIFKARKQANVSAAKMQIPRFSLSLESYKEAHGNYPSSEEGLQALVDDKLLKDKDVKDPWGNPFQYRYPSDHEDEFDIWSYGADGKEGGDGFNADITSWDEGEAKK